jgi:hypothetical protein
MLLGGLICELWVEALVAVDVVNPFYVCGMEEMMVFDTLRWWTKAGGGLFSTSHAYLW